MSAGPDPAGRLVVDRVTGTDPAGLRAAAQLFEDYRVHYGERAAPAETLAWLQEQVDAGRLGVFTAALDGAVVGLATTTMLPASLRLGCFWQVRDLYVLPAARRSGAARALLEQVRREAVAAGALRLALQTETGNAAALELYRSIGFRPVEGLQALVLPLAADARTLR